MEEHFSEERYSLMLESLFQRFPSFQKVGAGAYKPGIGNMEFMDQLLGHPHRKYRVIHVAGTNGKGSVSNMMASALSSLGFKVGLYTSPHILDFRERIRVVSGRGGADGQALDEPRGHSMLQAGNYALIPKKDVWNFIRKWEDTFDHLDMSFFEITTSMALDWFAGQGVDYVVLETGLGGRLDSTNIVTPVLSVITNIGLDHCDLLGGTLPEIAFEKAGIIKPRVPVVIGESNSETDPVFERKVLYTNLPEPIFMGGRTVIMSLLTFADKVEPSLWDERDAILQEMDLRGSYQIKNLRTVLTALDVLGVTACASGAGMPEIPADFWGPGAVSRENCCRSIRDAIIHTAARTGFRGRWEQVMDNPRVICDIGHNEHGLKYNFSQLAQMQKSGEISKLIMVYGSVADKDVDAAVSLFPENAVYIFTKAQGKRAMPAEAVREKYLAMCASKGCGPSETYCLDNVSDAVSLALAIAGDCKDAMPLVYVGGSTYVVSEAVAKLSEQPTQDRSA